MGAIFGVKLARVGDVGELPGSRVALVAGAGEPIWVIRDDVDELQQGLAAAMSPARAGDTPAGERAAVLTLLVGAEREGLPNDVVEACERVAHIPISSESLNAAMAATVALYEMTRGGRDNDDRVPSS